MKKLTVAALAVVLSTGVNAQVASESAGAVGALNVTAIVAGVAAAAVVGGVVSNNRKTVVVDDVKPGPQCKIGDGSPNSNGVCTNTTVTVTVTGTGTATSTITLPVVTTYNAS